MGLFSAQDELGKEVEAKRETDKIKNDAADQAKEEMKKEQQKHKEAKEQGMI